MAPSIVSLIGLTRASASIIPAAGRLPTRLRRRSAPVSHGGPLTSLCRNLFAIPRRRGGHERLDQPTRRFGHLVDSAVERVFVQFGWLVETADLPHELQRRGAYFVVSGRGLEIEQGFDVSAHVSHVFL